MNAEEFERKTGRPPECDDLERVNCSEAGTLTHMSCGWCDSCDGPRFECACAILAFNKRAAYLDRSTGKKR